MFVGKHQTTRKNLATSGRIGSQLSGPLDSDLPQPPAGQGEDLGDKVKATGCEVAVAERVDGSLLFSETWHDGMVAVGLGI